MIGKTLSHYEIVAKIGHGGMGDVYRARDTKLGREVALKILPANLARDQQALARFQLEAQTVAGLSHANIVTLHSVEEEAGIHFLTMELIEGRTLDQVVQSGHFSAVRILDFAIPIADALAAAHDSNIIHRDLKPSNILVSKQGQVKVLDFGLAKLIDTAELSDDVVATHPLTSPGAVAGTAAYMSPEQVEGRELDPRSDIFSFGIVLYEILAGRRPFAAESTPAMMSAILRDEPHPLGAARPSLTPEVVRIVESCLDKDPNRRFHSAHDLRNALIAAQRQLESDTSQSATPTAAAPKSRPKASRTTVVMVLAALAAVTIWYIGVRQQSAGPTLVSVAVLPFVNESGDSELEYLGDGVTENLINQLSPLSNLRVMARGTVFRYKGDESDPIEIGHELEVDAVVSGRVDRRGETLVVGTELVDVRNGGQIWGQRFIRPASDLIGIEREISQNIAQNLRVQLSGEEETVLAHAPTQNADAYDLYLKGRYHWYRRDKESVLRALDYFQRATDLDPLFARAHSGEADASFIAATYGYGDPSTYCHFARQAVQRALQLDPDLAEAHATLGGISMDCDWDPVAAEASYRRALELNPDYVPALQWLGEVLTGVGLRPEGLEVSRRAAELNPLSLITQVSYGWVLANQGQTEAAIAQFGKARDIDPESLIPLAYLIQTKLAADYRDGLLDELREFMTEAMGVDAAASLEKAYTDEGIGGVWEWRIDLYADADLTRYPFPGFLPFYRVESFTGAERWNEALAALAEAIELHDSQVPYMPSSQVIRRLTDHPRFAEVWEATGIPLELYQVQRSQ